MCRPRTAYANTWRPDPPRCHGCLKSVHAGILTERGSSSRLHQCHGWMWVSFPGGSSHSANQGKQAMLYLMIIPASVPHLSSLCETLAGAQRDPVQPSRLDSAFSSSNSSQFNQIAEMLACIINRLGARDSLYSLVASVVSRGCYYKSSN